MRYLSSLCTVALTLLVSSSGWAQEGGTDADADRAPHFLLASASGHERVRVDVALTPSLRRRISVDLEGVTLKDALNEIAQRGNLRLLYSRDVVPLDAVVRLKAENITVAGALSEVLLDAGVDVLMSPDGRAALVKRGPGVPVAAGSIVGRVTDAKTQAALAGATVVVEGTSRSAMTGNDGRYRITDVPSGAYTVRARYIGYAPGSTSVTVSADREATADFGLEKSVQRLDEVVTTGVVVPTEVKALPTPVSVISDSDLAAQRPHTVQEIFRQAVPTAVSWDLAAYPSQTTFAVRGASNLNSGSGQMKVFVDGIAVANNTFALLDPNSIARIEVIRGPQAAAIYGSDAVGGVIQVFTKRGDPSLTRPQVEGEAAAGIIQTPYAGYGSVVRQDYRGSASGGGPGMSYGFGAGYTHTPDWVQPASAQSSASVYGGVHVTHGLVSADVSGRQYILNNPQVFNPDLASTGFVFFSKPYYQPTANREQSLGGRLKLAATSWWHHTVTVGIDRYTQDETQTQPRLTSPDDTLLQYLYLDETKASVGYNTSVSGAFGQATTGSLTLGFDHYSLAANSWFTGGAPLTSVSTGSLGSVPVSRNITNNTGYFAQAQLAFYDALFVTGGVRIEKNTDFGDSLGTPVSPQVGLTYARGVGAATLKLRGSWGRAIRPPGPGAKLGSIGSGFIILPNPLLGPERQQGWDAGVDAVFGGRGSLSVTYFNQTAENLIDFVTLGVTPVVTQQSQNIGRVKNTGVEVEGALSLGLVQLKAQYGYVHSRILDLGPNYTGDLVAGSAPPNVPTHTAGASVNVTPRSGTTLALGATYVGSWIFLDQVALLACFAGTAPCRPGPGFRNYYTGYPSLFKLNATISQEFTRVVSGFVSSDNLTNNTNAEFLTSGPVMGRITTVGLRFRY